VEGLPSLLFVAPWCYKCVIQLYVRNAISQKNKNVYLGPHMALALRALGKKKKTADFRTHNV
jgi:hypothetical protein